MSRASSQTKGTKDGDKDQAGYKVVMPPDKFIPVSVSDITDTLRSNVRHEDRATFTEICQLVEGCATTEFASLRRRVKKNYRFFSHAAMRRDMPTRRGRGIKREDTMDEMEMTFLNDFWELMDTAHYKCMTQADWVAVQQERLMLDMPLDVNWDSMESRMLSRFFERHPDRSLDLFQHHDHALLFHRGVGVVRKKELWIMQKVDLIVNYLVARPTRLIFYKIAPKLWKGAREKARAMQAKDRVREMDPNALASQAEREAAEQHHPNAQIINRVSLRTLLPDSRSVLRSLFTQLEVVEPTYKDIIMLYRKTVPPPSEKQLKKDPKAGERYRRDRRGIFVKRFDEVPIADVEVVFPDNAIGLKAIDKLTLAVTIIGAFVAGIVSLVQGSLSLSLATSVLSTVGGKLYQTYATAQRKKADLQKQIANKVFDISMDAQEGACYSVLDEMADQYIKEQLLAYFTLLRNRYPASEEELDDACENWLTERFDVKIDFAIEESLPRLLADGLIVHAVDENDPRLIAVDLDTAHARLLEKWQTAFTYDESTEGSLRSSITQPFDAGMRAASNVGKAFGKFARVVPGATKLPGLQRHSNSDTAVTEGGTKLRKRDKFKRMFKHKNKHDDGTTETIHEHSQDLGDQ